MTGFRVALGGVQGLYQVKPDLTTLGKVIGGGMPVGAFGGKREIMEKIAPLGPVYQAGTLSGNPVAMTAGLKTLELISQPDFFTDLTRKTTQLVAGMLDLAKSANIGLTANQVGGMFGLFFTDADQSDRLCRLHGLRPGTLQKIFPCACWIEGFTWRHQPLKPALFRRLIRMKTLPIRCLRPLKLLPLYKQFFTTKNTKDFKNLGYLVK